jgi:hypothetical protein
MSGESTVDTKEVMDFLKSEKDGADKKAEAVVTEILTQGSDYMRNIVPVRTGNLMNGIHPEYFGRSGQIVTSVKYTQMVNDGTAPHVIEARNAKALAFPPFMARGATRGGTRIGGVLSGGHKTGVFRFGGRTADVGLIFRRKVFHPGTKGKKFVEKTKAWLDRNIISIAKEVLSGN